MRLGRLGLSAIDKLEIWSRWKAGETLHEIGRVIGKCHNTIGTVADFERSLIVEGVRAGAECSCEGAKDCKTTQTPLSPEIRKVIADTYVQGETSLRALAKKIWHFLAVRSKMRWRVSWSTLY